MGRWLKLALLVIAVLVAGASDASAGGSCVAKVTAYCPTCAGSYAADGTPVYGNEWAIVAVDPRLIPLQSSVYIEGLGTFRAADTGGGVRGCHIDVLMSSYNEAIRWGVQYRNVTWW